MIHDSASVQNGARLESDVCVIGGGMSGIAVALRLSGCGASVCLLEAGAAEPDERAEVLADGESAGLPYRQIVGGRRRVLGGSTNYWAGWCRPLDPIDFEARAWVPDSGWPIGAPDLAPYYREAARLCQIPDASFDPEAHAAFAPPLYRAPIASGAFGATVWVGSPPTKFGRVYRDALERADDIRVLLRANVTELLTDPEGRRVTEVRVRTLEGRTFSVLPRIVVLCAGAMETARLLLASRQGSRPGIGNEHDVVGRYFMEHPHVVTGLVHLFPHGRAKRDPISALDARLLRGAKARLAMERPRNGTKFAYALTARAQRERRLLNYSAHLRTASRVRDPRTYHAMKLLVGNFRSPSALLRQIRSGALPKGVGAQLRRVATHPDDVARILVQQLLRRPRSFEIYTQAEQSPDSSSRVRLGAQRDALGVPKVRLEWRMNDLDKASIRDAQRLLGEQLSRAGIGTVEPAPWLEDRDAGWSPELSGGFHHLGTARMGTDPRRSVVDAGCRVHSVDNLYVGDTSVFPTGGYANPLLTGAALALRTADGMREALVRRVGIAR